MTVARSTDLRSNKKYSIQVLLDLHLRTQHNSESIIKKERNAMIYVVWIYTGCFAQTTIV